MILAAVLGVAGLGALSQVQACEMCARLFQRTEGKLVRKFHVIDIHHDWRDIGPFVTPLPVRPCWVLQTADKTYTLDLGSGKFLNKHLHGLAAALEGEVVIVTGERKGDRIAVRDMVAKEKEYTGTLRHLDLRGIRLAGRELWSLTTDKGTVHLLLSTDALRAQARKCIDRRVRVKGRLTLSGIQVTAIEAA
jgi:hypothetical protein